MPFKKVSSKRKWNLGAIEDFEEVYNEYAPKLYGLCLTGTKNPEVSEDIVQEVFRKAWERRHKIDTSQPLENYFVKLAKHEMIDSFRKSKYEKRKKASPVSKNILETTPENLLILEEQKANAVAILKKFPNKTKRIFLLSRKHGITNKEIAKKLSVTEKSVEYHISKVLRRLKAKLTFPG